MKLDEFNALIEAIYAAGADPGRWRQALERLTCSLRGVAAGLHRRNLYTPGMTYAAQYNMEPEALSAYRAHYHSINPLNKAWARLPVGAAAAEPALLPRSEMRRSAFFNEFSRKFKLEGSTVLVLERGRDFVTSIGVVRPLGSEEFTEAEIEPIRMLIPHFMRAIDFNRRLASARNLCEGGLGALDSLDAAIFLLGEDGRVSYCNPAAEALLRACDGGLVLSQGRLRATHPEAARVLARLIHEAVTATGSRGGALSLPQPPGLRPLAARVLPVPNEISFFQTEPVRAALFVSTPGERFCGGVEGLAAAYGLTDREMRLTALLAEGNSVSEASDLLGIKKGTARKHLAHIMQKTETSRQAELVRLVLAGRLPVR